MGERAGVGATGSHGHDARAEREARIDDGAATATRSREAIERYQGEAASTTHW